MTTQWWLYGGIIDKWTKVSSSLKTEIYSDLYFIKSKIVGLVKSPVEPHNYYKKDIVLTCTWPAAANHYFMHFPSQAQHGFNENLSFL